MTLPPVGSKITMSMVAAELGVSKRELKLGSAAVRALAGKPTGPVKLSDLYDKSAAPAVQVTTGRTTASGTTLTGFFPSGYFSGSTAIGSMTTTTIAAGFVVYAIGHVSTSGNVIDFVGDHSGAAVGKTLTIGSTTTTIETATFDGDYTRCFLSNASSGLFADATTYNLSLS